MNLMDEILERVGLKYDDLNSAERETLNSWVAAMSKSKVTIEGIKGYINQMKDAVEQELSVSTLGTKQDTLLKARLRNYLLLEAFLTTPERAKQALDKALAGVVERKK